MIKMEEFCWCKFRENIDIEIRVENGSKTII